MPTVVQVAVPAPIDTPFDYAVPGHLADAAVRGCRVVVPFGTRTVTGVVVGKANRPDASGLKSIADVLDDEPALPEAMLRLCEWIAGYYFCGYGEALRAALPAGIEVESERRVRVATASQTDVGGVLSRLGPSAGAILDEAGRHEHDVSVGHLARTVTGFSNSTLASLERAGLIAVESAVRKPRVAIRTENVVRFADDVESTEKAAESLRGEKQRAIVEVLAGMREDGDYPARRPDLLATARASTTSLRGLEDRGIVVVEEREYARHDDYARDEAQHGSGVAANGSGRVALHEEQAYALEQVVQAVEDATFRTFLLHGVTGSGKTEVYIRALNETLERGRTGIILVPEIALTPQTVSRFRAHFGDDIAVLHSRMAPGERYDSWRHIRRGRHRVVIGPRSAVLAPLDNVGLIVVDEEHEHTYKQFEPAPRYHARDVAVMRAKLSSAVCVLGSATPSLETYANAKADKYAYLRMRNRAPTRDATAAKLPAIRVIDLTEEKKRNRLVGILSGPLRSAISERLQRKEQTILLQNRRGYAPTVECASCGWAPACPDCSVTMTYHKSGRAIRCHYCGRVERYPNVCGQCGDRGLVNIGVGTQRVEEEIAALFPDARLLRMDFDTTSRKDAHDRILQRFGRGDADILLGTQMVAKGLDFAAVTLVGVVDADTGLLFPDFRAEERTFQLLTQVAGRAGRGVRPGEVFLQTRNPGNPAITFALAHDYEGFAEYDMKQRGALAYPPFGRLVAVYFRGPDEGHVRELAGAWTLALREASRNGLTLLGPHPAFIARVRNQYRYVALAKVPANYGHSRLRHELRAASDTKVPAKCHVVVDIDAVGVM